VDPDLLAPLLTLGGLLVTEPLRAEEEREVPLVLRATGGVDRLEPPELRFTVPEVRLEVPPLRTVPELPLEVPPR
jgi:hypothetical protein